MKKILETKRLILREMSDDDFTALSKVIKDHKGNDYSGEYVQKWLDWCKSSYLKYGFGHWAVVYKETGEMIGSAGPSMQYIDDEWKPEIGYHIRKDFHRQGLGKEAAVAIRDYFFNHYEYDEVYCYMEEDNVPSYRLAESIGMKYLHLYKRNNETYRVYRMTKDEWKKI